MSVLQLLAHLSEVLVFFLLGEKWIRRTAKGKHLLELFEAGIAGVVRWRADASVRSEVEALIPLFRGSAYVLLIIFIVANMISMPVIELSLLILLGTSVLGWISLRWTFSHAATLRSLFSPVELFAFALGFVVLVAYLGHDMVPETARTLGLPASSLEVTLFSYTFVFVVLASGLATAAGLSYLIGWAVFGFITSAIVVVLYGTSQLSRFVIEKVNEDVAWLLVFLLAVLLRLIMPFL